MLRLGEGGPVRLVEAADQPDPGMNGEEAAVKGGLGHRRHPTWSVACRRQCTEDEEQNCGHAVMDPGNDPVNRIDPTGQLDLALPVWLAGGGVPATSPEIAAIEAAGASGGIGSMPAAVGAIPVASAVVAGIIYDVHVLSRDFELWDELLDLWDEQEEAESLERKMRNRAARWRNGGAPPPAQQPAPRPVLMPSPSAPTQPQVEPEEKQDSDFGAALRILLTDGPPEYVFLYYGTSSARAKSILESGFSLQYTNLGSIYLAEEFFAAKTVAVDRSPCGTSLSVLRFQIPRALAEQWGLLERHVIGEDTDGFVEDANGMGTGFERILAPPFIPAFNAALAAGTIEAKELPVRR